MTSLVPYASSGDDDDDDDRDKKGSSPSAVKEKGKISPRKRLAAFRLEGDGSEKASRVHTSLGIPASRPLKGDWLCYAFVSVSQVAEVHAIMEAARKLLSSCLDNVQQIDEPHISLTKPVLIRYHEKDQLLKKSKDAISQFNVSINSRFSIAFSAFTNLPSEDSTRIFWAVEIGLGWEELQRLISLLNDHLATLHAREYFKEARFHSSFAWISSDSTSKEQISKATHLLETRLGKRLRSSSALLIDKICVATGSQTHLVKLSNGVASASTLQ